MRKNIMRRADRFDELGEKLNNEGCYELAREFADAATIIRKLEKEKAQIRSGERTPDGKYAVYLSNDEITDLRAAMSFVNMHCGVPIHVTRAFIPFVTCLENLQGDKR